MLLNLSTCPPAEIYPPITDDFQAINNCRDERTDIDDGITGNATYGPVSPEISSHVIGYITRVRGGTPYN
jgi:hypothetical protein